MIYFTEYIMEMFWALFIFFALVTIVFIAFAYFFPEWIGITGSKAREIQAHQQEQKKDDSAQNP